MVFRMIQRDFSLLERKTCACPNSARRLQARQVTALIAVILR